MLNFACNELLNNLFFFPAPLRKQVSSTHAEATKDNVIVPMTLEEYCIKHTAKPSEQESDMTDFYDDDYGDDMEDEDEEDDDYDDDNEDSGNGES